MLLRKSEGRTAGEGKSEGRTADGEQLYLKQEELCSRAKNKKT